MNDKIGWYSPKQKTLNGYHYVYKDLFDNDVNVTNIDYKNQFKTCLFTDSKCVGPIYTLVKKQNMIYKVDYDFYKSYIELDSQNNFNDKLQSRISILKDTLEEWKWKPESSRSSQDDLIQEHFVEIFSWSALPYIALQNIYHHIKPLVTHLIDPCCGNGFHSYLFEKFTSLSCITIDIQDETNSWVPITVQNGLDGLKNVENQESLGLLLSWIDYEELCIDLLELFKGPIVVSIGNYHTVSPNYMRKLHKDYKLTYEMTLMMPWGMTEQVEIYTTKT